MVELRKRPARDAGAGAPPAKRGGGKAVGDGTGKDENMPRKAATATAAGKDKDKATKAGIVKEPESEADAEKAELATAAESKAKEGGATGAKLSKESIGRKIDPLDGFGGTVSTHSGLEVSLKSLLELDEGEDKPGEGKGGKKGVVIFTYPRASTPGCKFASSPCIFDLGLGQFGYLGY
jgi:hypothetical protein